MYCGIPFVLAPFLMYSDDNSGNKSKKWNKFDVWCFTLASLPKIEARQFQNMHFISCSNCLSAIEMSRPIVDDLLALEKGVHMFDALTNIEVLSVLCVIMSEYQRR